jgi:hypothetical protein
VPKHQQLTVTFLMLTGYGVDDMNPARYFTIHACPSSSVLRTSYSVSTWTDCQVSKDHFPHWWLHSLAQAMKPALHDLLIHRTMQSGSMCSRWLVVSSLHQSKPHVSANPHLSALNRTRAGTDRHIQHHRGYRAPSCLPLQGSHRVARYAGRHTQHRVDAYLRRAQRLT